MIPVRFLLSILAVLAMAGSLAQAQLKPGDQRRPVTATGCVVHFDSLAIQGSTLKFSFYNNVEKPIQGMEFGAAFYDSVQDAHRVLVVGGYRKHIAYRHGVTFGLDISRWKHSGYSGWVVWPAKVLYADGTVWVAGNTETACSIEHMLEKVIRPHLSPVDIMAQVPDIGLQR